LIKAEVDVEIAVCVVDAAGRQRTSLSALTRQLQGG